MKRFMVTLGFGSYLLLSAVLPCRADMPVSIQGTVNNAAAVPVAWHTDLQSGWREAKRLDIPMVIFITTDDCVYCDAMNQNTWCDQSVQQRLAGKFVAIRLNPRNNQKTLSRIKVDTFPTTLLGTPNGKVIGHRIGYQPPAALQTFLSDLAPQRAARARDILSVH
ncbi:MAG: thioredoxin family protein [Pirellulaceae bacterium]